MSIEVLDPGPLSTVQDRGRPGWAHLGVPRAGALDRGAAALARRLVGGGVDDAVVETTMGGIVLRARRAVTLAVTGASCEVRVEGRGAGHSTSVTVPAGAEVSVSLERSADAGPDDPRLSTTLSGRIAADDEEGMVRLRGEIPPAALRVGGFAGDLVPVLAIFTLSAAESGQVQVSGMSSHRVPGAMPSSGMPCASS